MLLKNVGVSSPIYGIILFVVGTYYLYHIYYIGIIYNNNITLYNID